MPILPRRVRFPFVPALLLLLLCLASLWRPAPAAAEEPPSGEVEPVSLIGIDDVLLGALGVQPQGRRIVIRLRLGAGELVSLSARGNVRQGGRSYPLRRAQATVAGGHSAVVGLRPAKGWQERRIRGALARGKTLTATIRVRFEDIVGNVATRTRTIELT